jgi:DNA-binding NarL/FixJ family response regulator
MIERLMQVAIKPIRIVVIDDHVIVRAGLRMLIENHEGLTVVGGGRNAR